jgi:phosphohistidine phosphatase
MSDGYRLYVVRHAIAEERGEKFPDDSLRPLSGKGIERFQKVARGLRALEVSLDRILTSPLVRSRQTADILAAELDGRPNVVEVRALVPDASYDDLIVALEACRGLSSIAIVGHEPSIGKIAARLAGMRAPLEFKKGAVCRVDVDTLPPAGPGALRWFATPKILAPLG